MIKKDKKSPSLVDLRVGELIRKQRKQMGMTQEKLGDLLGITFQQVQKYEKGINRVSASRLQDIASILHVQPSFFFNINKEDLDLASNISESKTSNFSDSLLPLPHVSPHSLKEQSLPYQERDPKLEIDYVKLLLLFTKISDPDLRQQLIDLAESLSRLDK